MAIPRERWLSARAAARRRPSPRIETCELAPRPEGGFHVVVRGAGLRPGAMLADLRVGDRPVRDLHVESDTLWRGVVSHAAPGDRVTLDLGPLGHAEGRAVMAE
jgi:hypothetical protein